MRILVVILIVAFSYAQTYYMAGSFNSLIPVSSQYLACFDNSAQSWTSRELYANLGAVSPFAWVNENSLFYMNSAQLMVMNGVEITPYVPQENYFTFEE